VRFLSSPSFFLFSFLLFSYLESAGMRENAAAAFSQSFLSFRRAGIYTSRRIRDFMSAGSRLKVSRRGFRGVLDARVVSSSLLPGFSLKAKQRELAKGEDRLIAANRSRCSFAPWNYVTMCRHSCINHSYNETEAVEIAVSFFPFFFLSFLADRSCEYIDRVHVS